MTTENHKLREDLKPMEANNIKAMRKALTALVNYLNKEVKRTSKCKQCRYRGKSIRGEPCYWHVDCGIDGYDKKASDDAMRLLKRFKLQKALSVSPRNCDRFETAEDAKKEFNYLWNFVWKRGGGYVDEREYRSEYEKWLFAQYRKENSMEASNVKDMREAIETLVDLVNAWKDHLPPVIEEEVSNALNKVEAVLSAPPRNCDVGTAEEQAERFHRSAIKCKSDLMRPCIGCVHLCYCYAQWMAKPYEEGGAK